MFAIAFCALLSIVAGWFLGDVLTGVFHWIEDRYVPPGYTLDFHIGDAVSEVAHHDKPTAMLLCGKWENIRSSAMVAWPLAALCWHLGLPWFVVLAFVFTAFGNLIHRFAHTPKSRLPKWILTMQRLGLFVSQEQHEIHHRLDGKLVRKENASRAYAMTGLVNWTFDNFNLWAKAEHALGLVGIQTVEKRSAKK